ncbi:VOC family protein [Aliiroseovarius sp. YM-037]|uniref:VOC family protein n=1 Tax=Aliiroseovarius sp. YM-037 TaxID=3341728 RepID=UPI003A80FE3A
MPPPPLRSILEATLYADDLDAAEEFYENKLGLEKIIRVRDRHVFFRVGPVILLIFNPYETEKPTDNPNLPVPPHGARGPGHLCFSVSTAEIDAWRAKLVAEGIEIESEFAWPNGARSLYFRDPAGNSVEIANPVLWAD